MSQKTNPVDTYEIILKNGKYWYLSLSENQYYLGRATLILKDPEVKHLNQLADPQIKELFEFIKEYEFALKKSFNTTNFNWACLMNNSYKEENLKNPDPLHFHIWPRYKNKVFFNKEEFFDEVFAHHYDKNKEKIVKKEFLEMLAKEILKNWIN